MVVVRGEQRVGPTVHEELRATRVCRAGVRHRKGAGLVRYLGGKLVLDVAAVAARLNRTRNQVLKSAIFRPTGASASRLGVLGERAAKPGSAGSRVRGLQDTRGPGIRSAGQRR